MKTVLLAATALLASCGIQTIEVLSQPSVGAYTSQVSSTQLTMTHDATRYASTNFQGYEVFYRIYAQPPAAAGQFSILAYDYNRLVATPTVDYLTLMGYQRLGSNVNNPGTPPLISGLSNNDTITLSFTNFVNVMNSSTTMTTNHNGVPPPPNPTIQVNSGTAFPVYRTITGTVTPPWFSDLYISPFTATSDMLTTAISDPNFPSTPIANSTQYYQICVFIAAYSFTPEQTTYSAPVPWGVIGWDNSSCLKVFQ